jgi:ATP-binding cassette subfamily B protein
LENLQYGADGEEERIAHILETADLRGIVERLPAGLQSVLGEGGGLVSGGEGQRVRLGRALQRKRARLVILDEPFRGLDRGKRRELLERVRRWWRDATLICITHDVSETTSFQRVVVLESGRVVEDANPRILQERNESMYRDMLEAESSVLEGLWSEQAWIRLHLDNGRVG